MPQLWQCDDCGTRYRAAWLSHCYRCEGRPPKPPAKAEKPSRRKKMPRIVTGVGPSNAWAELEKPLHAAEAVVEKVATELRGEAGPELVALAKDALGPQAVVPVEVAEAVVEAVTAPAAAPAVTAPTAAPAATAKETSA